MTHIWNWPEPIEFILVHSTEELFGKYSLLALWEALTGRFGEHGDPHLSNKKGRKAAGPATHQKLWCCAAPLWHFCTSSVLVCLVCWGPYFNSCHKLG